MEFKEIAYAMCISAALFATVFGSFYLKKALKRYSAKLAAGNLQQR